MSALDDFDPDEAKERDMEMRLDKSSQDSIDDLIDDMNNSKSSIDTTGLASDKQSVRTTGNTEGEVAA